MRSTQSKASAAAGARRGQAEQETGGAKGGAATATALPVPGLTPRVQEAAWSKQAEQRSRREERRAKKAKRRAAKVDAAMAASADDEWAPDDLANEARMAKRLKQGKITRAEYDAHLLAGIDGAA